MRAMSIDLSQSAKRPFVKSTILFDSKEKFMNIQDLEHIFEPQMAHDPAGVIKLFFMVQDGETATVLRHLSTDLEGLLPMLAGYEYQGIRNSIPRFAK